MKFEVKSGIANLRFGNEIMNKGDSRFSWN
jgi:hypothetical protein